MHDLIDARSLAMAEAIASKVDARPELLAQAGTTLQRWAERGHDVSEWSGILRQPWPTVRQRLTDPSDEGKRLRQSHPFGSLLTPQERWQLYRRFRDAR